VPRLAARKQGLGVARGIAWPAIDAPPYAAACRTAQPGGLAMIELYGMGSPNVVKIFLALEELAVPYNVHPVDVFKGAQFDAAFTKLNPSAKVPVIVDSEGPDGKPYTVFESGAILIYLAEKMGELMPDDPIGRYETIQWLMVQLTGLGPMFGQFVHFSRFAPKGNDYALSRYRTQVCRVLDVLEQRLAAKPWLAGADYTIADIAVFPWARNVGALMGKETEAHYPKLMQWVATIGARPAVVKALAAVDDIRSKTTQFDKAAPELLDKLFGRGSFAVAG
jgi:GST-like protein